MSVLLEALKKAAEEKKKQAGQSAHNEVVEPIVVMSSSTENVDANVPDPSSEMTDKDNDGGFEEPLSLKFNFEVDQPQQLDSIHATQDAIVSQEAINVDDADFVASTEIAENPISTDSDEIEDTVQQETHNQSTANEWGAGAFRLQGATQTKPAVSDDLETRLAVSEFDSNTPSSVIDISYGETDVSNTTESSLKDEYEDAIPDSWDALHSQSLPGDKVDKDSEPEASVKVIGSQEKPVSTNESQEHDWSLEQIPGYQRYGSTESQQKKTRLILPHLISKKSHLSSKWRLYFFSSILVLLGLAYYAMFYFDQQSLAVDSDLQRYQVLSKPRIAEQKVPSHTELQAKTTLSSSQQEVKQTDSALTETAPNKAIESSVLKEGVEPKADKAPSNTQKQVSHKKTELVDQKLTKQVAPKMTIVSREQESTVSMAFKAYQRSDWQTARRYYQQAYEEEPNSLPALFGLGAVAVQLGEQNKAVGYYQKVLVLEPGNQLAQKAILSIQSLENSNQQTIDELKSMEEASPDDPEITFALGNAYAKRKDWVTAQSYYFKAYQHNSSQPIYVLNLAVSLDHLGEYRLAKQYYDEALSKASGSSLAFNTDSIKKRLVVLNQFLSGEH
ncbi:MAG: tetratricopeptide repeat protein [Thiotrichales bacterium]|nr:tetratricopeptide repeat protein [Thiotrichales bacterium]